MLRNILIVSFIIGSASAVYLEYLKVDSTDFTDGISATSSHGLLDQDEDLSELVEKIPGICWVCQKVIKRMKKHIGNLHNVEKIKANLRSICDKIAVGKDRCKTMVNKHIDFLVKELSTDDDPKTVCAKAGMCKSVGMLDPMQVFQKTFQNL